MRHRRLAPISGDHTDLQWFVHFSGAIGAVLFGGALALSYEHGRKSAEGEVADAHRESTALKNEWVSVVSHELRTPLTAIKGSIGLLAGGTEGELPGQGTALLEVAERNAARLGWVIDDLLDLQKMEVGAMAYNREPVELAPFLQRCVALHDSFASQFGVQLAVDPNSHTVEFYADEQRLGQVVANLGSPTPFRFSFICAYRRAR
ncbi:MAG: signal transduction histidine kinase [Bradymonadia bacterium]